MLRMPSPAYAASLDQHLSPLQSLFFTLPPVGIPFCEDSESDVTKRCHVGWWW